MGRCNYFTTSSHQPDIHETKHVSYFQKGNWISRPNLSHQRYIKTSCHGKNKWSGLTEILLEQRLLQCCFIIRTSWDQTLRMLNTLRDTGMKNSHCSEEWKSIQSETKSEKKIVHHWKSKGIFILCFCKRMWFTYESISDGPQTNISHSGAMPHTEIHIVKVKCEKVKFELIDHMREIFVTYKCSVRNLCRIVKLNIFVNNWRSHQDKEQKRNTSSSLNAGVSLEPFRNYQKIIYPSRDTHYKTERLEWLHNHSWYYDTRSFKI